jgi:hypothetical protein
VISPSASARDKPWTRSARPVAAWMIGSWSRTPPPIPRRFDPQRCRRLHDVLLVALQDSDDLIEMVADKTPLAQQFGQCGRIVAGERLHQLDDTSAVQNADVNRQSDPRQAHRAEILV